MKKYMKIASIVMAFVMVITSVAVVRTTRLEAKSKEEYDFCGWREEDF